MPPESIGHYQILNKLGHGGMGEVYLAKDTKLDRTVAMKMLPLDVAGDPKRRSRFIQEARLASHLSHPNITQVYDVGETDGMLFIVMEYVEGNTLDALLQTRSLASEDIVTIALQITDALKFAHEKGIIHRDIKPSNIMITPQGYAKVLDFGLAKQNVDALFPNSEVSTQLRTEPGALIGTLNYMSPEQALGQSLDHRTDVFSFGCVLYEMATGRRAFSGATAAATIDSILHSHPQLPSRINVELSDALEAVIVKALRKDPKERYQTISDLAADLLAMKRSFSGGSSMDYQAGPQGEYSISRTSARIFFVILQLVYLFMYISTLRWSDGMQSGLESVFGLRIAETLAFYYVVTALIGIAVRLHLISLAAFDHVSTGVQFRKAFPVLFVLDASWALSPFGLSLRVNPFLLLAAVPPLVFSPFSQRTLVRSAYSMSQPKRTSVSSGEPPGR